MTANQRFHDGQRYLQELFDSTRLADRLEESATENLTTHTREIVERCAFFFIATSDADGWPSCGYRAGMPGFVHIADEHTLLFPDYDGNGKFRCLGDLRVNPKVGLLFVDFDRQRRVVIRGTATVHEEHPLMSEFTGAQLLVEVRTQHVARNCPRYIHKMQIMEYARHCPRPDYEPPDADWKRKSDRIDVLPRSGKGRNYPPSSAGNKR